MSDFALGFSDATNVLLADPSFSVGGTFTARGGSPISCRVIVPRTDPEVGPSLSRGGALNPAWSATITQDEIPTRPRDGDEMEILEGPRAGVYAVHGCREDSFSPRWIVELGAPRA